MSQAMKNVVITGSSSGFGESAAKAFADKGYLVWATMRDANSRNAAKKTDLQAYADSITVVEMDVASDTSVSAGFAQIMDNIDTVDVLINNAGIAYLGITEAFSVDQAHAQMNINYFGAIRVMQAVLPAMRQAGSGLIINTSSIVGRITGPYFGTYAATKHALEAYSQSLRYELAPLGVDVALVEPGPFATNLLGAGQQPERADILAAYGDLQNIPAAMGEQFMAMLQSGDAEVNPQMVVDAYMQLAEAEAGKRPTRTQVGISWGVDEINALTQPIQDNLLKNLQLDSVLGGVSA